MAECLCVWPVEGHVLWGSWGWAWGHRSRVGAWVATAWDTYEGRGRVCWASAWLLGALHVFCVCGWWRGEQLWSFALLRDARGFPLPTGRCTRATVCSRLRLGEQALSAESRGSGHPSWGLSADRSRHAFRPMPSRPRPSWSPPSSPQAPTEDPVPGAPASQTGNAASADLDCGARGGDLGAPWGTQLLCALLGP